jgi:hypothetical protein
MNWPGGAWVLNACSGILCTTLMVVWDMHRSYCLHINREFDLIFVGANGMLLCEVLKQKAMQVVHCSVAPL